MSPAMASLESSASRWAFAVCRRAHAGPAQQAHEVCKAEVSTSAACSSSAMPLLFGIGDRDRSQPCAAEDSQVLSEGDFGIPDI